MRALSTLLLLGLCVGIAPSLRADISFSGSGGQGTDGTRFHFWCLYSDRERLEHHRHRRRHLVNGRTGQYLPRAWAFAILSNVQAEAPARESSGACHWQWHLLRLCAIDVQPAGHVCFANVESHSVLHKTRMQPTSPELVRPEWLQSEHQDGYAADPHSRHKWFLELLRRPSRPYESHNRYPHYQSGSWQTVERQLGPGWSHHFGEL